MSKVCLSCGSPTIPSVFRFGASTLIPAMPNYPCTCTLYNTAPGDQNTTNSKIAWFLWADFSMDNALASFRRHRAWFYDQGIDWCYENNNAQHGTRHTCTKVHHIHRCRMCACVGRFASKTDNEIQKISLTFRWIFLKLGILVWRGDLFDIMQ